MSCHGNPWLKTPALDRLCDEGVRLTDFHVDPTCAPTRAALMTGRYSARVGVWLTYASRNHLRRDEMTMADVFRHNGYNAGMRGKKTSRYEGGHRAACFLHWPKGGLTGGRNIDGVTAHIDLLPTLIDLCDLQVADKPRLDGISLASVLADPDAVLPERSVFVHDQGRFGNPVGEGLLIKDKDYSVMQGTWRLVGKELYDVGNDPGQRNDIADQHPEVCDRLRDDYESWWESIAKESDRYCPFAINPAKQREVKITSQSLLGGEVAYNQRHVRSAMPIDGWAVIDVEVPGRYRISLCRWPKEVAAAIRATVPPCPMHPSTHRIKNVPCLVFEAVTARLKVGDFDKTIAVRDKDKESVFEVALAGGEQKIQTWFTSSNGEQIAAYYTYTEPL